MKKVSCCHCHSPHALLVSKVKDCSIECARRHHQSIHAHQDNNTQGNYTRQQQQVAAVLLLSLLSLFTCSSARVIQR